MIDPPVTNTYYTTIIAPMESSNYEKFEGRVRRMVDQFLKECRKGPSESDDNLETKWLNLKKRHEKLRQDYEAVSDKLVNRERELSKLKEIETKYSHQCTMSQELKKRMDDMRSGFERELESIREQLDREREIRVESERGKQILVNKLANNPQVEGEEEVPLKELNETQINTQSAENTPHRRKKAHPTASKSSTVTETPSSRKRLNEKNDNDNISNNNGIRIKIEDDASQPSPPIYEATETYYYDENDLSPTENRGEHRKTTKKNEPEPSYATPPVDSVRRIPPKRASMQDIIDPDIMSPGLGVIKSKEEQLVTPTSEAQSNRRKKKRKTNTLLDRWAKKADTVSNNANANDTNNTASSSQPPTIEDLRSRYWVPEDFIPNPEFNEGLDYAYKDTIRGKNQRKCQHGTDCTDCEKFYQVAGPGVQPNAPSWTSPQKPKRNNNNNQSVNVAQISSRHRNRYPGHDSPEGFWKSWMPNTQEIDEERRINSEKNKEKCAQRLEEALRGGKYIFKEQNLRNLVDQGYY